MCICATAANALNIKPCALCVAHRSLAQRRNVKELANRFAALNTPLHVLLLNSGVFFPGPFAKASQARHAAAASWTAGWSGGQVSLPH